eukprot:4264464-Heterocapsa_arctica.AAC.1
MMTERTTKQQQTTDRRDFHQKFHDRTNMRQIWHNDSNCKDSIRKEKHTQGNLNDFRCNARGSVQDPNHNIIIDGRHFNTRRRFWLEKEANLQ